MKKFLILIMIISTPALANDNIYFNSTPMLPIVTVPACVENFKELPKIAERLNVKEGIKGDTFILGMCDGRQYDFIALINARS